jgi:hypothetical protein
MNIFEFKKMVNRFRNGEPVWVRENGFSKSSPVHQIMGTKIVLNKKGTDYTFQNSCEDATDHVMNIRSKMKLSK